MAIVTNNPNVWQEPDEAAQQQYADISSGTAGAFVGISYKEPGQFLLRRAERSQFDPSDWFFDMINANATAYGADPSQLPQRVQTPQMESDQYNELYAPRDDAGKIIPIGDKAMPEGLARIIGQQMKDRIAADQAVSRFEKANSWPVNLLVNMAADIADPINAATMALPFVGEEAIAARLGLSGAGIISRTAARAASGFVGGAAQELPIAGLKAAMAPGENTDYGISDVMKDTLLNGASMAAMVSGLGAAGDVMKWITGRPTAWHLAPEQARQTLPEAAPVVTADATTTRAVERTALAQAVDGKTIDVADFYPKPPDTMTAIGLFSDKPYLSHYIPQAADLGLDRDQIARQLEPELFNNFDDAATRKATLSGWYNELAARRAEMEGAAPVQLSQADLQTQLDTLRDKMQGATKKQRAALAEQIADIRGQMSEMPPQEAAAVAGQTGTAAPEALRTEPAAPLPQGSISDIDAEIARLQAKAQNSNRAGREKIANRIAKLKDQQTRLAQEIGIPNTAATAGPERFEPANPERAAGATPFVNIPERPLRLTEFLTTIGGLRDNGDLRQIIDNPNLKPLSKLTRNEGFKPLHPEDRFKKLINEKGMSLEDAAERAQENGYFPDKPDRYTNEVDSHELLQAIDDDLRGNHRYSLHDESELAQFQTALDHNHEVDRLAQQHGINPEGLTHAQFFDQVAERQSVDELAEHIRSLEADRQADFDNLEHHFSDHPDLREGDIVEHSEHGPLLYEGPATLEDLVHADEAATIHDGQAETAANRERPVEAAGRAQHGESGVGQNGRAAGIERGAGTEAGGTATATGISAGRPAIGTADRAPAGRAGRTGPTTGDLTAVQRGLTAADYRMRDLAVRVSDAYRRADELIAMRVGSHAGGMLEDIARAQSEFSSRNTKAALLDWQRPDMAKFAEREKAWKETGVAPGIAQPELAKEIADVKTAAASAKPEPKPEKLPKDWGDPEKAAEKAAGEARGEGKPEGATPAAETKEAAAAAQEVTAIHNDIRDKVIAAGRPAEEAETAAAIATTYYDTRAKRLGITAREAYEENRPDIIPGANKERGLKRFAGVNVQGRINWGEEGAATIRLFHTADSTTFLHEMAHHWLEELMDDASDTRANAAVIDLAKAVQKWLGIKTDEEGFAKLISSRQHEKFAHSFQRYLMEGKAPTQALRPAFEQLKEWLTRLGQRIKNIGSFPRINDDVRGIFDRLLTEKPEIEGIAEKPAAKPAGEAGEARKPEAATTAPETKQATPAAPERQPIAMSNLPEYVRDRLSRSFDRAKQLGLLDDIERMAAEGKTARQVATELGDRLEPIRAEAKANGERSGNTAAADFVRDARTSMGIPSMDDKAEFGKWLDSYKGRRGETATPAASESITGKELFDRYTKTATEDSALVKKGSSYQDLNAASADMAAKAREAFDSGGRVIMHIEGKPYEMVAERNGRLIDAKGNPWGPASIITDQKARIEFIQGEAKAAVEAPKENPFPGIDMTKLLPEERAELEAAQADVAKAEQMEGAYQEAAFCLKAG